MQIRRLGEVRTILGEGPYWDVKDQVLFFVDIVDSRIWRFDPESEQFQSWTTPVEPGGITRTIDGGFMVAMADGYYAFDPDSGSFSLLAAADLDGKRAQINDVKVDRRGRFIGGGRDKELKEPIGAVHSYDGKSVTTIDTGYVISNGPCWSPDGKTFYLADSLPKNEIYAYDYDLETGAATNKRLFAKCEGGYADGATVDAEGRLWMALCGEGNVVCYNPDGSLHRAVPTGVKWVSSVQFGGPDLDKLYVTSLDAGATGSGFEPDENSGYLYVIEGLGVKGLPEPLALAPER